MRDLNAVPCIVCDKSQRSAPSWLVQDRGGLALTGDQRRNFIGFGAYLTTRLKLGNIRSLQSAGYLIRYEP